MDSDSSDAISTSSSDEIEIDNSTKSPTKVYTQLQNVNSTPPMSDISSGSSSIRLEFTSSGDNTSPSPPSSQSSYGKYSTTYPPSHTSSINSSPHCDFPSDNSTESTPTPLFPEDIPYKNDPHNDSDSGSSLADFNIHEIQIPKSETVVKKRAVLQLTEIPFSILMQWIRTYLISIENDPNKPDYPVPNMDKNQKRNFRRTTEKFKIINGHLKHLHVYINEKNKVNR